MNNFWQRTITGILFVAVLVGAVLWNKYSLIGLFFVVTVLGLREYALLFNGRENKPNLFATMVGGVGIALVWALDDMGLLKPALEKFMGYTILACLAIPFITELLNQEKTSFKNIGLSLLGIVYINLGFGSFIAFSFRHIFQDCLSTHPYYYQLPLAFLIIQWSSDTFAYLTGRAFGKTPLAPKISPKKTWEGSIGGAICTMVAAFLLSKTLLSGILDIGETMGLALVIIIFGSIGDLVESKLKRTLGVKDSGNILPGHGGILDRFDSLLLAAPFALLFLMLSSMW